MRSTERHVPDVTPLDRALRNRDVIEITPRVAGWVVALWVVAAFAVGCWLGLTWRVDL